MTTPKTAPPVKKPTVADLARRIEALEREVAKLRSRSSSILSVISYPRG